MKWADVELPPGGFELIWEAFLDLSSARQSGFGPSPIPLGEIKAWQELTGNVLSVWEVSVIRQVDRVWLKVSNARSGNSSNQSRE